MSTTDAKIPTKVITGIVRFSYLHVWEAVAVEDGGEKKYSVSLIIPKSDTDTLTKIKVGIDAAKEAGKSGKFGGKIPANLKTPLRDGDIDRPDDEAYANSYFITANARTKPGLLALVKGKNQEITKEEELYSGCFGRASITFYAFNTAGNRGIAAGLNNLQKVKDGEPLGGRNSAESDFAEYAEPGDFDNDVDDLI